MGEKNLDFYTVAEYLELEKTSKTKYEYINGYIHALAGGSVNHNTIGGNIIIAIGSAIKKKGKKCRTMSSDTKVYIKTANAFVFPDATIVCGKVETSEKDKHAIINPLIMVEVLSPSTAKHDKGRKFIYYQQLESLKEYIIIHQNSPIVEQFYKKEDTWTVVKPVIGLDKTVHLSSLDLEISMQDIYDYIDDLQSPQLYLNLD